MMTQIQVKEPVVVEIAVLQELSPVAAAVLLKQRSAQGARQAVVKAVEAERSDLMWVGQQGTAVAVVLAAEVLVEVVAAVVVVTVLAVASVAAAAAAAVEAAAKAEELSVKCVEPFDCKKNNKHTKAQQKNTATWHDNSQFIHRVFKYFSSSRTFQETTIEDNSFIAYTVYAIIIMNKNEHESPHSDLDRAVLSASLQDSFIPTIN